MDKEFYLELLEWIIPDMNYYSSSSELILKFSLFMSVILRKVLMDILDTP